MGETNQHLRGHFVVPGAAGSIGSHRTRRPMTGGHTVVGIDSLAQRRVYVLRLSAAGDVICMLTKRT